MDLSKVDQDIQKIGARLEQEEKLKTEKEAKFKQAIDFAEKIFRYITKPKILILGFFIINLIILGVLYLLYKDVSIIEGKYLKGLLYLAIRFLECVFSAFWLYLIVPFLTEGKAQNTFKKAFWISAFIGICSMLLVIPLLKVVLGAVLQISLLRIYYPGFNIDRLIYAMCLLSLVWGFIYYINAMMVFSQILQIY
jgi:hypothetical protein